MWDESRRSATACMTYDMSPHVIQMRVSFKQWRNFDFQLLYRNYLCVEVFGDRTNVRCMFLKKYTGTRKPPIAWGITRCPGRKCWGSVTGKKRWLFQTRSQNYLSSGAVVLRGLRELRTAALEESVGQRDWKKLVTFPDTRQNLLSSGAVVGEYQRKRSRFRV